MMMQTSHLNAGSLNLAKPLMLDTFWFLVYLYRPGDNFTAVLRPTFAFGKIAAVEI
jgi:hypothetical protein